MKEMLMSVMGYWWIFALTLGVVFYKALFKLFGVIIIPENKIGLVTKKFVLFGKNKSLPDGRIIALNGEPGYQAETLSAGLKWGYWPWQYEVTLQNFIVIPTGNIGIVNAKDGAAINTGSILARYVDSNNFQDAKKFITNGGQKGSQAYVIPAGTYRINTQLFEIKICEAVTIQDSTVGIITALDGIPLDQMQIAGDVIDGHLNFQDFDKFLTNGGKRGLQAQVIQAGKYYINPMAVSVKAVPMTEVPIASVGVVVSYIGDEGVDITGDEFKHGDIVKKGEKGVCVDVLNPGKYAINPLTTKVECVPTQNLVLNWADARNESHKLDAELSTITVRSKDGFPFNLDVSQIISIPSKEAPKVIARFGSVKNLVSQVLEPLIGNYFRNSAQNSDVIDFIRARKQRQEEARIYITSVLKEYNVHAVDTLIGDINPPDSLMKTLTDRKIAEEQQVTYDTQMKAQEKRQEFTKAEAVANIQPKMVEANQGVEIAEKLANAKIKEAEGESASIELRAKADATRIRLSGDAEASKIKAIGDANANAYEKQVKAMGQDNFTNMKLFEQIGKEHIKITPDILINSGKEGGDGTVAGLLALRLQEVAPKPKEAPNA